MRYYSKAINNWSTGGRRTAFWGRELELTEGERYQYGVPIQESVSNNGHSATLVGPLILILPNAHVLQIASFCHRRVYATQFERRLGAKSNRKGFSLTSIKNRLDRRWRVSRRWCYSSLQQQYHASSSFCRYSKSYSEWQLNDSRQ